MGGLFTKSLRVARASFALSGDINVNSLSSVGGGWDNTGVTLTLPHIGTYIIHYSLSVQFSDNTQFDNKWLEGRLHDTTNSLVVPQSNVYIQSDSNLAQNADFFATTGYIVCNYVTTVPNVVLRLETSRHSIATDCYITQANSGYGYVCMY